MKFRYNFVFLFDALDCNPNGDPDAGNQPRADAETGHGLVSDVCIKRKIRNYVSLVKNDEPPFEIYMKERAILNNQNERAYMAIGAVPKAKVENVQAREWMCKNFYDVRTFGAVMATGINCGQVRGPVQVSFSRSVDPILIQDHTITRCAVTTIEDSEKQQGGNKTMGHKFTVPYGLYRCHGYVNPFFATQTGFDVADLELFWQGLQLMFENDASANRGGMAARALIVFEHNSALGSAPASVLEERVKITRLDLASPARSYRDYKVEVDEANLPAGVKILRLL